MTASPVKFRLEAGTVELDVSMHGLVSEQVAATYLERMAAFVDQDRSEWVRSVIACDWTVTGTGQQKYDTATGGHEPVSLKLSDTAWWVDWCYYRMGFSSTRSDGTFSDWGPGLEHALRGAAIFPSMPETLFFHAATLVYSGRAFLIAGSPNAGKSTIAREGLADRVLSNEISILAQRDGEWWALPSPFWGTGDVAPRVAPAPLAGLVVLSQAKEANEWTPLAGARGAAALLPHAGSQSRGQANDPALLSALAKLSGALPTYSLAWHRTSHPLEGSPWKP